MDITKQKKLYENWVGGVTPMHQMKFNLYFDSILEFITC